MATFFSLSLFFSLLLAVIAADNGGTVVQQRQLWCVAMNNAEDSALQQALDWACGPGAADCGPIQQGGPCYDPTDLIGMASYAFNDYCLKHGMTDETCNFSNTAALTALDPSHDKCKFASSHRRLLHSDQRSIENLFVIRVKAVGHPPPLPRVSVSLQNSSSEALALSLLGILPPLQLQEFSQAVKI